MVLGVVFDAVAEVRFFNFSSHNASELNKADQISPFTISFGIFWRPTLVVLGVVFNAEYTDKIQVSQKE